MNTYTTTEQPIRRKVTAGGVLSVLLSSVLSLSAIVFVVLLLMTIGPTYGFFDIDDILFDVLSILGSGTTPYETVISIIQLASWSALAVIGVPCLVLLLRKRKNDGIPRMSNFMFGFISLYTVFLFSFLILLLFDFDGFARTILLILFFASAAFIIPFVIRATRKIGASVFLFLLFSLVVGLTLAMVLVPITGWLFTVFGDIVWVMVLLLVGTGGARSCFDYVIIL